MVSAATTTLRTLKRKQRRATLGRGLALLPEDLLLNIFALSYKSAYDWETSFRLASVCQRFRALMLASPRMWTAIHKSLQSKPKALGLCLQRSRDAGLAVSLNESKIASDCAHLFSTEVARWSRLDVCTRSANRKDDTSLRAIGAILSNPSTVFPRLSYLHIKCYGHGIFKIDMFDRMPILRQLHITSFSSLPKYLPQTLVHLNLCLAANKQDIIDRLRTMLQSTQSLRSLCLALISKESNEEQVPTYTSKPRLILDLDVLQITVIGYYFYPDFFQSIYLPNIATLEIMTATYRRIWYRDRCEKLLAAFFDGEKVYPRLRELTAIHDETPCDKLHHRDDAITPIELSSESFRNCPSLDSLTISMTGTIKSLPPSKNIHLINCSLYNWKWLATVPAASHIVLRNCRHENKVAGKTIHIERPGSITVPKNVQIESECKLQLRTGIIITSDIFIQ